MRKLIVKGLFSSISKLETYAMLNIPPEIIFKIPNTVDAAERVGVQVDWINRTIRKIEEKKFSAHATTSNLLRTNFHSCKNSRP